MKRKLALFLALVMILSLVPANVFAASSNGVNKVPTVADDHEFGLTDAPLLKIEEDADNEFDSETQTFVLKLENAEWDTDDATLIEDNFDSSDDDATLDAEYISTTRMQIAVKFVATGTEYIKIPMLAELQGEGAAKVIIEDKGSAVTSSTITFAIGSGGDTTVTIDDTVDARDTLELENIIVEENVIATFDADSTELNLKILDNDMSWNEAGTITFSGGMNAVTITIAEAHINDNVLTVDVEDIYSEAPATGTTGTVLGMITFAGLEIDPDDASYGEVQVKVYGDDITTETIVVGNYVDYEITAEADDDDEDLPVLYAGDLADGYEENDTFDAQDVEKTDVEDIDGEENELSVLVLEEGVAESWMINRETKVSFPDWVKIIDVDVSDSDNIIDSGDADISDDDLDYDIGDSEFTFDNLSADDTTATMSLELAIFVSIEADHADEDIIATVSGRSLDQDYEVKLGMAVAPLIFDIEVADIKTGIQDQTVGKIIVTEYAAEVLNDEDYVTLSLEGVDGLDWADDMEAEVTKGDITIDEVDGESLIIDNESTEASTIELTAGTVDVNRSLAEGNYDISLGSNLILNNESEGDAYFFDTDEYTSTAFLRVITPADSDVQAAETVSFTIDAMEYKIGDVVVTMDAAPFIDASNRTMLPLRAFANALGVSDNDILWNGTERSVTIFKGDRVVKVVIGEMSFMMNGVSVPMDTMAIIKDGRTFLPVRALGQALGAEIGWDAATRTVTID